MQFAIGQSLIQMKLKSRDHHYVFKYDFPLRYFRPRILYEDEKKGIILIENPGLLWCRNIINYGKIFEAELDNVYERYTTELKDINFILFLNGRCMEKFKNFFFLT